jgi:hypothetical protein
VPVYDAGPILIEKYNLSKFDSSCWQLKPLKDLHVHLQSCTNPPCRQKVKHGVVGVSVVVGVGVV